VEESMTVLEAFTNEETAELFEEVIIDTKILEDFLAYFKKITKHTKDLSLAFDRYLISIEDDLEAAYADGKVPSEDLVPPLLADQYTLVQKLLLACAKFSNL
jgi:hypothetical protein